jgi:hypothetical protein
MSRAESLVHFLFHRQKEEDDLDAELRAYWNRPRKK